MHVKGNFHIQIHFMKLFVQAFQFFLPTAWHLQDMIEQWSSKSSYKLLIYCIFDACPPKTFMKFRHKSTLKSTKSPENDSYVVVMSALSYWFNKRKVFHCTACITKLCIGTRWRDTKKSVSTKCIKLKKSSWLVTKIDVSEIRK